MASAFKAVWAILSPAPYIKNVRVPLHPYVLLCRWAVECWGGGLTAFKVVL
jgi:hypothetical protein